MALPRRYESIFNFGDSVSDTGNFLSTGAVAFLAVAKLPYGKTFSGHPTGCFSDGRLMIDFIDCDPYFKKSLFLVGEIGGNDYNFLFTLGASVEQLRFMVPLVVGAITNATSMLIKEGAVDLVVPGNFPIGCWTVYLALFHSSNESDSDLRTGCLKAYNEFSKYHNSYVKRKLQILGQKYRHARIMYADCYGAATRFFCTPNHYGFNGGTQAACCGGGGPYHFDLSAMCGSNGSTLCTDPSALVNWDGIHSTEAVYQVIAKGWLHGPFTSPHLIASKSQWDNALASILLPKTNLCSWS